MTTPLLPTRHSRTTIAPPARAAAPSRLSTAGWSRLRHSATTAIFTVATVVGVTIGVRAVDISPAAPPVAVAQPAPLGVLPPPVTAVAQPAAPTVVTPTLPVDNGARTRQGTTGGPGRGGGGRRLSRTGSPGGS